MRFLSLAIASVALVTCTSAGMKLLCCTASLGSTGAGGAFLPPIFSRNFPASAELCENNGSRHGQHNISDPYNSMYMTES